MINFKEVKKENTSLGNVYAFITISNRNSEQHFYIVSGNNNIIDISSDHTEVSGYETVENFALDYDETVLKIYEDFDDFELTLTKG